MLSAFSKSFSFGRRTPAAVAVSGIVTSGLIAHLDASNSTSYPGSGSTWTDIQGSNDGTINGATYSATNGGIFVFDGVNDTIEIPDSADLRAPVGGVRTIQTWVKVKSYDSNDGIWGKQYGSPSYDGYSLAVVTGDIIRLQMNGATVNGGYNSATNAFTTNTWMLLTAIVRFGGNSLVYKDNNSTAIISVSNAESSIPSPNAPFVFGRDVQEGSDYADIDIGALYVYNKALTTSEISQNYDATKTRFGL